MLNRSATIGGGDANAAFRQRAIIPGGFRNTAITSVDGDGVALAAIQGLNQKLEEKLQQKETEITELKKAVIDLTQRVDQLAAELNGSAR